MTPARSPAQIRAAAAVAWRRHMHLVHANTPKQLRPPFAGETPLSAAEIRFGAERGLLRTPITHHAGA